MRHIISVIILLPFSVEPVSLPRVNSFELFLEVGGEVDGGVEVLPDESVVLHIPNTWIIIICFGWSHNTWWSFAELHFLLSDTEFRKLRQFQCFQSPEEDSEAGFKCCWLINSVYLEWDEVSPDSGLVSGLDFIIEMVKDDIIDELIPSENFSDFADPSFSNFDTMVKRFQKMTVFLYVF